MRTSFLGTEGDWLASTRPAERRHHGGVLPASCMLRPRRTEMPALLGKLNLVELGYHLLWVALTEHQDGPLRATQGRWYPSSTRVYWGAAPLLPPPPRLPACCTRTPRRACLHCTPAWHTPLWLQSNPRRRSHFSGAVRSRRQPRANSEGLYLAALPAGTPAVAVALSCGHAHALPRPAHLAHHASPLALLHSFPWSRLPALHEGSWRPLLGGRPRPPPCPPPIACPSHPNHPATLPCAAPGALTDGAMLTFILRRLRASTVLMAPFEKLQRKLLKAALGLFGSADNAPRVQVRLGRAGGGTGGRRGGTSGSSGMAVFWEMQGCACLRSPSRAPCCARLALLTSPQNLPPVLPLPASAGHPAGAPDGAGAAAAGAGQLPEGGAPRLSASFAFVFALHRSTQHITAQLCLRGSGSPLLAGPGPPPCRAPAFVRLTAEGRAPAAAQRHAAPCAWLGVPHTPPPFPTPFPFCFQTRACSLALWLLWAHPPPWCSPCRLPTHLPHPSPSLAPRRPGRVPRLLLQRQVCQRRQPGAHQLHGGRRHRDVRHQRRWGPGLRWARAAGRLGSLGRGLRGSSCASGGAQAAWGRGCVSLSSLVSCKRRTFRLVVSDLINRKPLPTPLAAPPPPRPPQPRRTSMPLASSASWRCCCAPR